MISVRGRLIILTYHRVLQSADELFPTVTDAAMFERHVTVLKRYFRVLPLSEAVEKLGIGTLPPRAISITFDDGYNDNFAVAMPILIRHQLKATFFVATGYLDGGRMWNDTLIESIRTSRAKTLDLRALEWGAWPLHTTQQRAYAITKLLAKLKYLDQLERDARVNEISKIAGGCPANNLMMNADQVRGLCQNGMEVGAHTITHPILMQMSADDAMQEIVGSRERLMEITGGPVVSFAYPNGKPGIDYDQSHVNLVRQAGYRYAVSTAFGPVAKNTDPFQLARVGPWDRSGWKFGLRLLRWYFNTPPNSTENSDASN